MINGGAINCVPRDTYAYYLVTFTIAGNFACVEPSQLPLTPRTYKKFWVNRESDSNPTTWKYYTKDGNGNVVLLHTQATLISGGHPITLGERFLEDPSAAAEFNGTDLLAGSPPSWHLWSEFGTALCYSDNDPTYQSDLSNTEDNTS